MQKRVAGAFTAIGVGQCLDPAFGTFALELTQHGAFISLTRSRWRQGFALSTRFEFAANGAGSEGILGASPCLCSCGGV